jgi:polygalacturonase
MSKSILLFFVLYSHLFFIAGTGTTIAREHNILDFGAKADTAFLSTKAIQQAIEKCSLEGGKVVIPRGNFKTGTIYLKSNVTLRLENGATIYGSKHLNDYPENSPDFVYFRKGILKRALFYAENCANIAIEGEGTIDGQGAAFWIPEGVKVESYSVRPYIFWMIQCSDIRAEGIKLRNSAFWMQHYIACDNLYIRNIDVFNHSNKNNDMMDIDGCHNVHISDCTGDSDDDGITLKSTTGRANENIVITNCIVSSHCNAIKMGTESSTGFKNIAISNIVIRPSKISYKSINGTPKGHAGIAIETMDGGFIDGVVISNIRIDGPACPIFIRRGLRARPYYEGQKIEQPGELKNISISNVVATNAGKTGCSIAGIPGYPVENISLSNISIEFEGGGTAENINREVPEEEKSYPEFDMFGELPSFGFFIRHADNIRFSDVQLKTKLADARPAVMISDVSNSEFESLKIENTGKPECLVLAENSREITFSGSNFTGTTSAFLKLKDAKNEKIRLINNVVTGAEKLFVPENMGAKTVSETGNLK